MAKQKITKFRNAGLPHGFFHSNMWLMMGAFSLAVMCVFILAVALKADNGIFDKVVSKVNLKNSAVEKGVTLTDVNAISMKVKKEIAGYGRQDEQNVGLMNLETIGAETATIKSITVHFEGYGSPSDIASVQLYNDGKFIQEKPFFEGKAVFDGLKIEVSGCEISIKGKISESAPVGDQIRLKISAADDVKISSDSGDAVFAEDFPMLGRVISILGK